MAPGLHAQKKASQKTAAEPVTSQLKSRPFASEGDRQQQTPDSTTQTNTASSLSHNLSNLSVLSPASVSTQPIQLMPVTNVTGAQRWNKLGQMVKNKEGGMDLNTRYNLSPLADSKRSDDIVDSARDSNKILDLSTQAKAKQRLGEAAPDPLTGMIHHHYQTVKELNTAKYRFDRSQDGTDKMKQGIDNDSTLDDQTKNSQKEGIMKMHQPENYISQTNDKITSNQKKLGEQTPDYKPQLQTGDADKFSSNMKDSLSNKLGVTKIIPKEDADKYMNNQRTIPALEGSEKPAIGGFHSLGKFSEPLSAPQAVQQFGLGYGWEKNAQGKWAKKASWASDYVEQDPSKNPKTQSGLKGVDKVHYLKSDMTPELLNETAIPMTSKMHNAVGARAKAYQDAIASGEINDPTKWSPSQTRDGFKALQVSKRTIKHEGDNPYTGTGSSASGPELEAKSPAHRAHTNLITEFTTKPDPVTKRPKRATLNEASVMEKGTEAGKDQLLANYTEGTGFVKKPNP